MKPLTLTRILITLLALSLLALVVACDSGGEQASSSATASAASNFELNGDAAAGEAQYQRQCATCHGMEGKGDGAAGRALTPSPTNFAAQKVDAERAYKVIKDGGMSVGLAATMPGFERSMSDQEIRDVTAYIRSLAD